MSCAGSTVKIFRAPRTGDFTLTGGNGRFAGIGGGGKVTLRSEFRELVGVSGGSVVESVSGIMFWPSLSYQLP